jgi:putative phosphoesterase
VLLASKTQQSLCDGILPKSVFIYIHPMTTIRIGLISDTHGLVRPEARVALSGVDRIIHAGDICDAQVLQDLAQIAPVVAVRGNNDRGTWAEALPDKETLQVGGVALHVLHDLQELDIDPVAAGIKVVITGHSHRPTVKMERGVLYVNPGSAGPRRFKLPISLGFLEITDGVPKARVQTLEVD